MNIGFCYESVLPARGGCETYIASLARRLVSDGHDVHLYACTWDGNALPPALHYHRLPQPRGPRFLRPWLFAAACERALEHARHDVTIGFDKTWGQDVLYPQGGLHTASAEHNLRKHAGAPGRGLARLAKGLDLAHWSYCALERRQYQGDRRPLIVAISNLVARHFQKHYGIAANELRVVHCGIDPERFAEPDRPRSRQEWRAQWGIAAHETVALFIAMNYQLKGLEQLLHAVQRLPRDASFRLLVVGNPKTGRYQRLARRLGIGRRVCFLGPQRDVQHGYFAADFLVHPTFYDPCSLVALEALACGLPVITTRFNGASELLHPPHDGYVIPDPHDHAHLAWCMTQLLDRGRRIACTQAVRRTAGQWTWDHHYRRMLQVLTEAAARRQAA
jgi:UDP-glucose:(heptosyl)LPS alpha-1,3-glucosyltransferase